MMPSGISSFLRSVFVNINLYTPMNFCKNRRQTGAVLDTACDDIVLLAGMAKSVTDAISYKSGPHTRRSLFGHDFYRVNLGLECISLLIRMSWCMSYCSVDV